MIGHGTSRTITIIVANIYAIGQTNLKRMLAWSSVAQIGYILLGAGFSTHAGLTASVTHMFNHALSKGALFLAVMCLLVFALGITSG